MVALYSMCPRCCEGCAAPVKPPWYGTTIKAISYCYKCGQWFEYEGKL